MGKAKKKQRRQWRHESLELAPHHGYRARPGYGVFVLGHGAVRFDIPTGWEIEPRDESVVIRDKEDTISFEATFFHTPPHDWSDRPLVGLLKEIAFLAGNRLADEEIRSASRSDAEILWYEYRYEEPNELREAVGRSCLARGNDVHLLLSFAFWPECREQADPIWEEATRSLQLGQWIDDPRVGPRIQ